MKIRIVRTIIVISLIFIQSCSSDRIEGNRFPELTGEYLGQKPPGDSPELFAPGIISTREAERDAAFSPDGKEFYYSMTGMPHYVIMVTRLENGRWTRPEVAPFSGHYSDLEPFYSPDGKRIFYSSNRPLSGKGEPRPDFDILYVEKTDKGWSDPINVGSPVNTDGNEFFPSVSSDGTLYLTASYDNSLGMEDIFKAEPIEGGFAEPEDLGPAINSESYEYNAFIAPDESYLIYSAHARKDGFGSGDLYISFRNEDGTWSKAKNMGETFNTATLDFCPSVTPDKKYMFFSSPRKAGKSYSEKGVTYDQMLKYLASPENGLGDIYWVKADIIDKMR